MGSVTASAEKSTSVGAYTRAVIDSLPARGEKWSLEPKLFELARRLKDVARDINGATLDEIAAEWFGRMCAARPAAMSATDVEEVRSLLKNGFGKARRGFAEPTRQKEALAAEFAKVKAEPLSDAAKRFKNPGTRATVQLCEAYQRLHPNCDFELGETLVAGFVGCSQPRAGKYLDTLREAGVIELTAERVKHKVARRFRLIAVVKSLGEKIRDVFAAVGKLFAGATGKATAASEPAAPEEPSDAGEPCDESHLPDFLRSDFECPAYDPDAHKPAPKPSRERDGPREKKPRKAGWHRWTLRRQIFEMCRRKPPKCPAQSFEPEPI